MDKRVTYKVETLDGSVADVQVNVETKVQHLLDKTIKEFGIEPGPVVYELRYGDKVLEPARKIEEYAIPDGSVLILQNRPRVG